MNLTHRESSIVFQLMHEMSSDHDEQTLRAHVGESLADLLGAEYMASYIWDEASQRFTGRVSLNMSDDNLTCYEDYFQFCDPITPALQNRRCATCVSEVISRDRFERTEFFNDFLKPDGLHYGINFYNYAGGRNIGDMRIWRGHGKADFTRRDVELLDHVGLSLTGALLAARRAQKTGDIDIDICGRVEHVGDQVGLTRRQREICAEILRGRSDQEITQDLSISLPTVRSHLRALFDKFNVSSHTQLSHSLSYGSVSNL